MTSTVRKNSIEAREMWSQATRAITYTLNNCFVGQDVTVEGAQSYFDKMMARGARATIRRDRGKYVVRYHSNHWVELLIPTRVAAMREP